MLNLGEEVLNQRLEETIKLFALKTVMRTGSD